MDELLQDLADLKTGAPEQAKDALQRLDLGCLDVSDALRAGGLAEELGLLALAVSAYNRVLELDSDHGQALRALAELRREQGDWQRADRLLARLQVLGEEEAAEDRVALLAQHGQLEAAKSIWDTLDLAGRERCAGWLGPDEGRDAIGVNMSDPLQANDGQIMGLLDRFRGREGVHARQWCGPDGRSGYSPVRQPLTPSLLRQHLACVLTLGVYVVRHDQTCCFLAFDLDIHIQARRSVRDARDYEALMQRTKAAAQAIRHQLEGLGLAAVVEASGGKGHHVWTFFAEPLPASKVRHFGRVVLAQVLPLPEGVSAEVFPAQGKVKPRGFGSLIKLPLGLHQRSGRRSLLFDREGRELSDPLEHLLDLPRLKPEAFETLWKAAEGMEVARMQEQNQAAGTEAADEQEDSLRGRPRAVPTEPPYFLDGDVELAFLLERCRTLKRLVAKACNGQVLKHDEQAVIIYTLGHLPRGATAVNAILQAAGHPPPLKSPLRGHPTSCRKIRARLELKADKDACNCSFDSTLGSYAHPMLHLSALSAQQKLAAGEIDGLASDERLRLDREIARLSTMRGQLDAANAAQATGTDGQGEGAQVIPFPGAKDEPGES